MDTRHTRIKQQVRILLVVFIAGLAISGITAFPIQTQLEIAHGWMLNHQWKNAVTDWLEFVYAGVNDSYSRYPFIAYGTDWLAFAHLVIAIAFIGPLRDPVKNIWVIEFGMIACLLIFPLALIAGSIRGIPFFWQMIDCAFGFFGGILLWICYRKVKQLDEHAIPYKQGF